MNKAVKVDISNEQIGQILAEITPATMEDLAELVENLDKEKILNLLGMEKMDTLMILLCKVLRKAQSHGAIKGIELAAEQIAAAEHPGTDIAINYI